MISKREYIIELIKSHEAANFESNKDEIHLLLKEFARRLLLWIRAIRKTGVELDLGSTILLDVAYELTGIKGDSNQLNSILRENQMPMYYSDKNMFDAYFNWRQQKELICQKGYNLPNPYVPYVEIFRRGGHMIKYQYSRLEVYPFFGIIVEPKDQFLIETPFWTDEETEFSL